MFAVVELFGKMKIDLHNITVKIRWWLVARVDIELNWTGLFFDIS